MGAKESKLANESPSSDKAPGKPLTKMGSKNQVQTSIADIDVKDPLSRPRIADSICDIIGATPMLRIRKVPKENNCPADIILKLESMQPCNSVKDRLGKGLIEYAEQRGEIKPGETVIVESTSGNTGIGLAMVAAAKGYKVILTMPESMSLERKVMLKALGAQVILTPASAGMKGAIQHANEIIASLKGKGISLDQFGNLDNQRVHRETTGPEIWAQCEGEVDILIAGVGTGGTISGIAQYLKEKNPQLEVIAVEPLESAVMSGRPAGPHKIQGIGAGFVPNNCDMNIIDEIFPVKSDDAIAMARRLASYEGVFVGISSGATVKCAIEVGKRPQNASKRIVVICASFGERYLSTALFADLHAEAESQQPVALKNA